MRYLSIRVSACVVISLALTLPVHSQQTAKPPANSPAPAQTHEPKTIVGQSITGDVYRSGGGHFTLTVPDGWRTNDDNVEPKFGVGGLSSPDNEIQLEIQQMPTTDTPATFARKIDAK